MANKFKPARRTKSETADGIRSLISSGMTDPAAIASEMGIAVRTLFDTCSSANIDTPFPKTCYETRTKIPSREAILDRGLSTPEMEEIFGISKTSVFKYIKGVGRHGDWTERRDRWVGLYRSLERSDPEAYQSVINYLKQDPFTPYPIPALHKLFHKANQLSNTPGRLESLSHEFHLHPREVLEILETADESRRAAA